MSTRSRLPRALALVSLFLLVASIVAYSASNSHSKLNRFESAQGVPDSGTVNGSSAKLTRGDGVVWIRINTTGLPPGAYTNWWVIFNYPQFCTGGCGADDFSFNGGNPDVMASVFFAAGGIVGQDGVGQFRAHLEEGPAPPLPSQTFFGPGLLNAQGAEIHYILRDHGPASSDPDLLQKQLTTKWGGCDSGNVGGPDPVPADRIYPCYDPQATALPLP